MTYYYVYCSGRKFNLICPKLRLHNRIYRNVSFVNALPKISHSVLDDYHYIVNLCEFWVWSIIRCCHHPKFATGRRITIGALKQNGKTRYDNQNMIIHRYRMDICMSSLLDAPNHTYGNINIDCHFDIIHFLWTQSVFNFGISALSSTTNNTSKGNKTLRKANSLDKFSPMWYFADSIIPIRTSSNSIAMAFCILLPKNLHCLAALAVKCIGFLQIHLNVRKTDFEQLIFITSFYAWICDCIHRKLSDLIMYPRL